MTQGWPLVPGVPALGHVARNGFWHPGRVEACPKAPCAPPPAPRHRREEEP